NQREGNRENSNLIDFGLGLLLMLKFYFLLEFPPIKQLTTKPYFSPVTIVGALGLIYYLYHRLIKIRGDELLVKSNMPVVVPALFSLMLAFAARGIMHYHWRSGLGKISFFLLLLGLVGWIFWPLKQSVKSFLLHVFIIALSALVFEQFQILFVLMVIFVEARFFSDMLAAVKPAVFITLYLALSALIYYTAYGNLSLNSFFEEGRESILGAQITDFSYWNLTLITMFLIAKLVLVEVVSLLPLTQWKSSIMEINGFS